MRKKWTTKTHTKNLIEFESQMFDEKDIGCFVVVKKIKKAEKPFCVNGETLVDDGYMLIEITPKNSNFNVRVFFDEERNILQHYIDISKSTGFDSEMGAPYYDDLFLDIIIGKTGDIRVLDEDELEDALKLGIITQNEFDFAVQIKDELLKQIQEKTNVFIEMDIHKYMG